MSKTKNSGLDQYGAEPFDQQQFGTAGVEGVNDVSLSRHVILKYHGVGQMTRYCGTVGGNINA